MSGYYNPPPNSNLIGGYSQQGPLYPTNASGLPSTPGHAPQPPSPGITNPGYFGNPMYPSQIPAAAPYAYQQPPFGNNPQMNRLPSPSEPPSKRPLPAPSGRPASVIYPPQAMPTSSFQSSPIPAGIPVQQRSMTFDPAAYNAMMLGQGQGTMPARVNHAGFNNNAGGARPASVHFPPGWNPYPNSPVGPPTGPSSFSGPGRPKKDADLPPLPPASNVSPPMTPGSGIISGKKALPNAPGNTNGSNINMGAVAGWNAFPPSAPMTPSTSSPPEKRPLPTPSQSLPRISTILPGGPQSQPIHNASTTNTPITTNTNSMPNSLANAGSGVLTSARAPSPSSPTKRALPAAPGNGGIQPGTTPLPTSPTTSAPTMPLRGTPPPTSAPSSYASARSVFSTQAPTNAPSSSSSSSGFTTAPSSFNAANARPSSYSAPSPPPTGAPRSNASDNSGGEVDKRPLWKRMAGAQASSRPQSVFGHRRGVGSVDAGSGSGVVNAAGNEMPASSSGSQKGMVADHGDGSGKPVARRRDTQPNPPTSQPMEARRTPVQPTPEAGSNSTSSTGPGSVPSPSPAARKSPLPTPPTSAAPNPSTQPLSTSVVDKPQTQPTPAVSKLPAAVQPTPIIPYQPKSKQPKVTQQPVDISPTGVQPKQQPTPPISKAPAATQPTPIIPYQPKTKQPREHQQPKESQPQAIIPSGTGGKVRFSQEAPQPQPVNHVVQPLASKSPPRAAAASPPRPSAMKGRGAKSPPRADVSGSAGRMEAHSRVDSSGQSRLPQSNQTQHQQHQQPQHPHQHYSQHQPPPRTQVTPPEPQISMALRFASMDIQDEARATDRDWAKWALVSSHDVATKPVPLSGYAAPPDPPVNVRRKDSGRRRSASTGAPIVSLDDPPPPPAIAVRRGSFDETSPSAAMYATGSGSGVDTDTLIQAASANGGMRRGGARPMPNPVSRGQASQTQASAQGSRVHGRVPSVEEPYPQYKPSYSDSEDEENDTNPRITISTGPPQISVTSPPNAPSITIEGEPEMDVPSITFTIDEPEASTSSTATATTPVINAASVPIFSFDGPDEDQPNVGNAGTHDGGAGKKKKHKKEKSVKEEEDERERARQLARTRPLPPKIKKNSARCGKCDKPILGRIVSAMNARWHPECFRCSVCETFLEHVSSYEHDDRPYCHLDYHELFAPRCFHCKTPIMEEHFITLDDDALGKRTYHEQHFFCAECGDPFLAPKQERKTRQLDNGTLEVLDQDDEVGFTVYKGHPYCEACHVRLRMPKCKRCRKSIRPGDQAIEALGGKWCWECFTCNRCSKPFEDPQFYEHDQKPFCQPCYSILLVNQLG